MKKAHTTHMARHRPLENRDFCAQEDLDRVAEIPQEEFDLAALKCVMFADAGTDYLRGVAIGSYYLSLIRLERDFADEIADMYGIYGSKTSEVGHLRAIVHDRLSEALKNLLDEQKQKHP